MNIKTIKIEELKPYANNPRFNDDAVEYVANSIKEFGFKVPIIVDKNNVIVAGHTRYKASLELGLKEVPCIVADDLNEEQIKAFRLADNKVSEKAEWNFELLDEELNDLDLNMDEFGFDPDFNGINFIDDLLENEFAGAGAVSDKFSVTFVIDKKYEDLVLNYIKDNGKDKIVEEIIKFIKQ